MQLIKNGASIYQAETLWDLWLLYIMSDFDPAGDFSWDAATVTIDGTTYAVAADDQEGEENGRSDQ